MQVVFRRTGERRYAVLVSAPGRPAQWMDPAPGYDAHIPHDLVHYVVEAELGLQAGVYGRAASGGGTFFSAPQVDESPRDHARRRRKQQKRERSLARDESRQHEMLSSERLAALCDLAWRRRHGQRPDPARSGPAEPLSAEDAAQVERVVARLDVLAEAWSELPIGGELTFVWPSVEARVKRSLAT